MGDALLTRPSLLVRLRDPEDGVSWRRFVELYGALVYGFARQRGLQDADAADLTQEVFLAVARAMSRRQYDPARGSFRGWLYGIARRRLARLLHRRASEPVGSGNSTIQRHLSEQPGPDPEADWEHEFQKQLFRLAAAEVRPHFAPATWDAFWQTAVEGKAGAAVAAALGLSVGAVYVARSRVLARLTEHIRRLQTD
jgi:RNA polymerase sigma-70 factor (ECF subfamily)